MWAKHKGCNVQAGGTCIFNSQDGTINSLYCATVQNVMLSKMYNVALERLIFLGYYSRGSELKSLTGNVYSSLRFLEKFPHGFQGNSAPPPMHSHTNSLRTNVLLTAPFTNRKIFVYLSVLFEKFLLFSFVCSKPPLHAVQTTDKCIYATLSLRGISSRNSVTFNC